MAEKTPLELDLEHREKYITPGNVKVLIGILAACLIFLGIYTLNLKQELANAEKEAEIIKTDYVAEKIELLRQIKQLQKEPDQPEPARADSIMPFRDQVFADILDQKQQ